MDDSDKINKIEFLKGEEGIRFEKEMDERN